MRWTNEQQASIEARGCNLLVSAAAGSGKTAVITQRALELIVNENIDISRILMITFTEAAAMEMRSRLGRRMLEEINAGGDTKRLSAQLEKLNDSNISTVHAYCISLLRRNYHSVGIDPNFTVLGEDAADYQMRAISKVLDEKFDKKEEGFLLLGDTLGGRGGEKIENIALELYAFIRTQPDYIDLLNMWTEEFNLDKEDILDSHWARFIKNTFLDTFEDMITLSSRAKEICLSEGGPASYAIAFEDDMNYFKSATEKLKSGEFEAAREMITGSSFMTLPRKKKEDDAVLVEMAKSLRATTKDMNKKMAESIIMLPPDETAARHKKMYPALCALRDIIIEFDKEYKKIKKRRRQLDFEDLQHTALEALKNDAVAEDEKRKFDYIFVDEYQDTNKLQECIIEKVTSKNNLLCVGDVKQSIYAFRQADPGLFINRMEKSSIDENAENRIINLNKNFRSAPGLIESINLVFDTVMSARLGQVDYGRDERLYYGENRPEGTYQGSCELIILDEENVPTDNMDLSVEREACIAARRIKEIMGGQIYDSKKGIMRPVKYSDICILSKSFKPSVIKVRRVLEQYGIPVMPQESGEYFDEIEIGQTLDILTIINNKRRDKALISAMASPAFGFEMAELLAIRKAFKGKQPFYSCVLMYSERNDILGQKVRLFLEKINTYKDMARYISLKGFIWRVLDETGLYSAVGALPGGAVRQGNMRLLLDRAESYSKIPGSSLHGFLSYIKRLRDNKASIGAESGSADDAVQYMSIHKSKGLEFPIVIVINANKRPADQDTKKQVMTYKDLGFGTKYYNPKTRERKDTLSAEAISRAGMMSVYSEEMRVYYVALTRAQERLIVIGSTKKGDDIARLADKWASPFIPGRYFGYDATLLNYMGCAAIRNIACGNLRNLASILPDNSVNTPAFKTTIIKSESIEIDRTKRAGAVMAALQECAEMDVKKDFIDIDIRGGRAIPAKTTATAVMRDISNEDDTIQYETLAKPEFISGERAFTSAEIGTMTHKVLEKIDFDCSDIAEFAEKLEQKRILPEGGAKAIDLNAVEKFLSSDVVSEAKQSANVMREVPFVVRRKAREIYTDVNTDEAVMIQGIIDMCYMKDGKWVIIDYKTNKVTETNTRERIINEYRTQLDIYCHALESITGTPVDKAGLYLLSVSEIIWADI
ncbi:MAG: helicase-exonuclease AddAB subunit AddA [Clostridia bacterium]|nr:helicase-exonuclease AddAB subunit AddA [Clostridia bacterium]